MPIICQRTITADRYIKGECITFKLFEKRNKISVEAIICIIF